MLAQLKAKRDVMTHRRQVKRNGRPCSEGDVATSMVPSRDELEGPELLTTHSRAEQVGGNPGEVRKRMEKTEPWREDGGENPELRPSGYRGPGWLFGIEETGRVALRT